MKINAFVFALSLVASACSPSPAAVPTASVKPSGTPASSFAVTSSPTASAQPVAYRVVPSVPGRATASPDGRWIAAQGQQDGAPLRIFASDGTPLRELANAGRFWGWLPDSSGLFVALMIAQRAPSLTIVELDGRLTNTELQLSHQTLSRDGKLIVAEQQEGCCVSIIQREIRVARRDGGGTRTLALSQVPSEPQTVALLGVDASDRGVYRDGTKIMRIDLAGGAIATLATAPDYTRVIAGNSSPDGAAITARGYEPARWFVIANDRVTAWDDGLGAIVEDGNPGLTKSGAAPLWIGPHTLLARDTAGSLAAIDALTSARAPLAGKLVSGDVVLAHQRGILLVVRGGVVILLDTTTGAARDIGLDLRPNHEGAQAVGLPSGGFLLSSSKETYRID